MMKVPVLEIFGPTFQGEGAVIGRKTMFVRTAGCDYSCSWCDSAFTWDGSQKENIRMMSPEDIFESLDELAEGNYNHVTISGGNPALLKNMEAFVQQAKGKGIELAMETQGTALQEWMKQVDDVTVSPKPPSSNMNTDFDRLNRVLAGLDGGDGSYNLKVVVFDEEDFEYAATGPSEISIHSILSPGGKPVSREQRGKPYAETAGAIRRAGGEGDGGSEDE